MESEMNALENLFHEKILLYQELVESLKKERALLIETDMDGLWDISDEKQLLVSRIEEVRGKILDAVSGPLSEQHRAESEFSLASVMSIIPQGFRSRFRKKYLTIVHLKTEAHQRSVENKVFVEQSLDFLDELINVIAGSGHSKRVYNNSGALRGSGSSNLLLSREA